MTPLLKISNLVKTFRGVRAVDGASLEVMPGRITGLIGPNGSGKSTTIDCFTGFQRADGGEIQFDGQEISALSAPAIARLGLMRTFQDVRVYPNYNLLDNLLVVEKPFDKVSWAAELFRTSHYRNTRGNAEKRARDLIELVGLTHLIEAPAAILSYGQKKLLSFAAAMMASPRLVVLDEPVAGVNPTRVNEVADIIRRVNGEGTSFLVVEHNVDFISALCHHVLVFDRGRKLTEGNPADVHRDPLVLDAYLGLEVGQEPSLPRLT
jgi:branched-chain amino acid transport system ATP-binding protein